MICKSRKGHAASMMTDIMQELRSLEVHKRSKKQFSTTQTRPDHTEAAQLSTEEHDENHCCCYTADPYKLGGNISQSEISNIEKDRKSDNKKYKVTTDTPGLTQFKQKG